MTCPAGFGAFPPPEEDEEPSARLSMEGASSPPGAAFSPPYSPTAGSASEPLRSRTNSSGTTGRQKMTPKQDAMLRQSLLARQQSAAQTSQDSENLYRISGGSDSLGYRHPSASSGGGRPRPSSSGGVGLQGDGAERNEATPAKSYQPLNTNVPRPPGAASASVLSTPASRGFSGGSSTVPIMGGSGSSNNDLYSRLDSGRRVSEASRATEPFPAHREHGSFPGALRSTQEGEPQILGRTTENLLTEAALVAENNKYRTGNTDAWLNSAKGPESRVGEYYDDYLRLGTILHAQFPVSGMTIAQPKSFLKEQIARNASGTDLTNMVGDASNFKDLVIEAGTVVEGESDTRAGGAHVLLPQTSSSGVVAEQFGGTVAGGRGPVPDSMGSAGSNADSDEAPPGEAHDEMLFIITHQAYELWFKQILHELESVYAIFQRSFVEEEEMGVVCHRLHRITTIQKVMHQQIQVLETMTPMDFLDFRDYLVPASGFQSCQFRLIELVLGIPLEGRKYGTEKWMLGVFEEKERERIENV